MKAMTIQATQFSKYAFSGGSVYFLLHYLDVQQFTIILHRIDIFLLLIAIGIHFIVFLIGGLRWWLLLRYITPNCMYSDIAPSYFLGLFSNNFLPTGFGGDIVRTVYLSTRGYRISTLLSSTLIDRALGLAALLLTGFLTMIIQNSFPIERNSVFVCIGFSLVFLISMWLVLSNTKLFNRLKLFQKNTNYHKFSKFNQILFDLYTIFHTYYQAPCLLLIGMLLSLILQILVVFVYIILGRGLGLDLSFTAYFVIIPIVMLATNIPISLGGLGLREGVLVALLVSVGIDYEQGVLLSLSYLVVLWITTLPGGLILIKIHLPTILWFPNPFNKYS